MSAEMKGAAFTPGEERSQDLSLELIGDDEENKEDTRWNFAVAEIDGRRKHSTVLR